MCKTFFVHIANNLNFIISVCVCVSILKMLRKKRIMRSWEENIVPRDFSSFVYLLLPKSVYTFFAVKFARNIFLFIVYTHRQHKHTHTHTHLCMHMFTHTNHISRVEKNNICCLHSFRRFKKTIFLDDD